MIDLNAYLEFLTARGLSKNYYNAMKIFLEYLQDRPLSQEEITKFFLENEYGEESRNLFIKAGRNYSIFLGQTETEWHKIKLLKCKRKIPDYLSEKELGQAIAYLITYHGRMITSAKADCLLSFLFYSGARKNEMLELKRSDFDLEECVAKVYGKGKKERLIYFPKKVSDKLIAYFESEKEVKGAFNLSLYDVNYLIKALKKHFTDKNITVHLFRHSGAREMLRKGIPIAVVSKILGHASLATTMIYADENEEGRRNIYKEKMK